MLASLSIVSRTWRLEVRQKGAQWKLGYLEVEVVCFAFRAAVSDHDGDAARIWVRVTASLHAHARKC